VTDFISTRHHRRAIGDVAVAVLKLIRRQADAERKPFLHHQHLAFEPGLEHEQHRRLHGGLVGEIAADADGDVQGRPVHVLPAFLAAEKPDQIDPTSCAPLRTVCTHEVFSPVGAGLGLRSHPSKEIKEAATALIGKPLGDDQIQAAAEAAYIKARPLDNTDFVYQWRKQMARQYTLRALRDLQS